MGTDLCKYKDIFGKPNQGVHSIRIFGLAFIDLFLTILLALFIAYMTKQSFIIIFIIVMLLGLIMHKLFCVQTTLTKLVFG